MGRCKDLMKTRTKQDRKQQKTLSQFCRMVTAQHRAPTCWMSLKRNTALRSETLLAFFCASLKTGSSFRRPSLRRSRPQTMPDSTMGKMP